MMRYCFNPVCLEPQNSDLDESCRFCGSFLCLRDRYYAIQVLGTGGLSRTLLALDTQTSLPCVMKQFGLPTGQTQAKAIAQFHHAAHRLEVLGKHPQIPEFLNAFTQNDCFYWVQSWIAGSTLSAELQAQGTFDESKIWQILDEVLPVLQFIHAHQMIHQDIKPEHLIRSTDGHLVLVDFEAAEVQSILDLYPLPTSLGSPEYAAPEQVQGHALPASDLYSLGVTCIHLLTDLSPFDLFDVSTNTWIWEQCLPQPISDDLTVILNSLIASLSHQRFQSAHEAMRAIQSRVSFQLIPTIAATSMVSSTTSSTIASTVSSKVSSATASTTLKTASSASLPNAIASTCLSGHLGSINAIALHPNQPILASTGDDKTLRLWDLTTSRAIAVLTPFKSSGRAVDFSPDGRWLAVAGDDKTIQLWDWQTRQLTATLSGHTASVRSLHFSPCGQFLASASRDKTIRLWQLATHTAIATLSGHSLQVNAIAFSPAGHTLASASCDRTARLWSVLVDQTHLDATTLPTILSAHVWSVTTVAFSPDGHLLATGSEDNTVKLWQVSTGQVRYTLTGHSWSIAAVAFNSDGNRLLSGSWDHTVKLWDVATGAVVANLVGASDAIYAIALHQQKRSPDCQTSAAVELSDRQDWVVAAGRDACIYVWQDIEQTI